MNKHGSKWIRVTKREAIYRRDGWTCVYCGARYLHADAAVKPGVRYVAKLTLDHIVPRELGGTNLASNLVTACFRCNSARQAKHIRVWFAELRARGIDTDKIGPRIRRLVRKELSG